MKCIQIQIYNIIQYFFENMNAVTNCPQTEIKVAYAKKRFL